MHQSIVTTATPGPGNSGDFRSSQSQVKSPPCGDKRLVNSPPNAQHPGIYPYPSYFWREHKTTAFTPHCGAIGKVKHATFPPLSPVLPRTRGQWFQLTGALFTGISNMFQYFKKNILGYKII